jgi:hypothetical protein
MPDLTALWFLPSIALAMAIALFLTDAARSPANLVPIQILGAGSIVTLVLAQVTIVIIATVMALAFIGGLRVLLLVPAGIAAATLLRAIALVMASGRRPERLHEDLPPELQQAVDEIRDALGSAANAGFDQIDVEMIASEECAVETAVSGSKRLTIRVGRPMVALMERSRGDGDPDAMAALLRFVTLHEISHFINGDVHTYRLSRAVHLAHAVWLWCWPIPFLAAFGGWVAGAVPFEVALRSSVWGAISMMIALVPLASQRKLAARFCAQREELADWRASELLSPRQSELLFRTKGSGGRAASWLLTRMNLLEALSKRGKATWTSWLWPAPPPFRDRVRALIGGAARSRHDPSGWARELGIQTGMITVLFVLSTVAWGSSIHAELDPALRTMLWALSLVWMPLGTYAIVRTDPRRLRYFEQNRTIRLLGTAAMFVIPADVTAFVGFLAIALPLGLARVWNANSIGTLLLVELFVESFMIMLMAWVFFPHVLDDGDGGSLKESRAEEQLRIIPPVVALVVALLLSVAGTRLVTSGQSALWVPVWVVTVIVFAVFTVAANSRNRLVRALVPVGMLPSSGLICGVRLGWRNLHIDATRSFSSAVSTAAALVSFAVVPIVVVLVAVTAFVESAFGAVRVWQALMPVLMALALLILAIKSDRERFRWGDPTVRLLTSSYLGTLAGLLRISRNEPAQERLAQEVREWLADDRLPDPLLPTGEDPWYLVTLRHLLELSELSGSTAAERWRTRLAASIEEVLDERSCVNVRFGSRRPSLLFTANASMILHFAGLCDEIDCQRILKQIPILSTRRIRIGGRDSVTALAAAAQALELYGRTLPAVPAASRLLRGRPHDRQSLLALYRLACVQGDEATLKDIGAAATSRACRVLLRNPRKEVLMLLDCYETAIALGMERNSLFEAARVVLIESAESAARDLRELVARRRER